MKEVVSVRVRVPGSNKVSCVHKQLPRVHFNVAALKHLWQYTAARSAPDQIFLHQILLLLSGRCFLEAGMKLSILPAVTAPWVFSARVCLVPASCCDIKSHHMQSSGQRRWASNTAQFSESKKLHQACIPLLQPTPSFPLQHERRHMRLKGRTASPCQASGELHVQLHPWMDLQNAAAHSSPSEWVTAIFVSFSDVSTPRKLHVSKCRFLDIADSLIQEVVQEA